jgi:hypothetical protein
MRGDEGRRLPAKDPSVCAMKDYTVARHVMVKL